MPKKGEQASGKLATATNDDIDAAIAGALERMTERNKAAEEEDASPSDDVSTVGPRCVVVAGVIDASTIKEVAERLAILNAIDPTEPITAVVASEGGLSVYGWALHDMFATNDVPVLTIGYGILGSAGTVAFLGGRYRLIAPNTCFIIHAITRDPESKGHTAELFHELGTNVGLEGRQMALLYAKETGTPLAEVHAWMGKETRFTARQAVRLGFADKILKIRPRPSTERSGDRKKKQPNKAKKRRST